MAGVAARAAEAREVSKRARVGRRCIMYADALSVAGEEGMCLGPSRDRHFIVVARRYDLRRLETCHYLEVVSPRSTSGRVGDKLTEQYQD
jgi:hypothetical protein